jgi:hypothetical protein
MECKDKNCIFNSNNQCKKLGKCLKNVDNSKIIQRKVENYWNEFRRKYQTNK